MNLIPGLDEALKIANKFIPDKNGKIELEKKLIEVNSEIVKSNKETINKVIPLTFPVVVWVLVGLPTIIILGSVIKYWWTGTYYELIPIMDWLDNLFYITMVFISGLVGKWNIDRFWQGKNKK